MSAERLLKIIRLLQSKEKLTTKQLADITAVSERTILRDMDTLTLAGIPVISERGKYGGWRLMEHFQDELGHLQLDMLKALFILPSESILQALDIDASSTTLKQSLLSRLPARARRDAHQYFSKLYIDTSTWRASTFNNTELIKQLQSALWEDRKLRIKYEKAGGECSERIICPIGLVAKSSSWYVVAMNEQEQYRSFNVSRIMKIDILQDSFIRPAGFELSQFWENSKSQFIETLPVVEATVLAHSSILPKLRRRPQFIQRIEVDNEEPEATMTRVVMEFNSEHEIVEYVLSFGAMMKLLQPEHLIPQIIEHTVAVMNHYGRGI